MRHKTNQHELEIPKTPRTKPAEVRLDELMAAAEHLFLVQGVDATTINEIVKLTQVAKGIFYHYFASKNELLEALKERYTTQFLKRLEEAIDTCKPNDWLGRLCTWIRVNIETYAETYRTHDIVYANHHHHDRNNQEKNTILKQLQAILENGTQAKVWQVDHPHITALLIYAGVHGATDDIIVSSHSNREVFIHAVIANCLRMVDIVDDDTLQNHSC